MKRLLSSLSLFFLLYSPLIAGPDGKPTADPTYFDGGNAWRPISVRASTTTPVVISTDPANAVYLSSFTLNFTTWRYREIVNTSTCASLMLLPDATTYASFSSSFSVVLSSDPLGLGQGDSYVVPGQGAISGIWSGGCGDGGYGAGGIEAWWDPKKVPVVPNIR